jgi:hypothetical protein
MLEAYLTWLAERPVPGKEEFRGERRVALIRGLQEAVRERAVLARELVQLRRADRAFRAEMATLVARFEKQLAALRKPRRPARRRPRGKK